MFRAKARSRVRVKTSVRALAFSFVTTGAVLAGLPLLPTPAASQEPGESAPAAAPRPLPPPKLVRIGATGFEPKDIRVMLGQSSQFTNESGAAQTVPDADAFIDSGPIPPGGGYALTIGEPGYTEYASPAIAGVFGSITVVSDGLPGTPGALVNAPLPDVSVARH